ncbi:MAG: hypothetical protein AAFR65_12525 [Pseudomonadota bacterium]
MPALHRPNYMFFPGTRWYMPTDLDTQGTASEGWKLHIVARAEDAQTTLDAICENVLYPDRVAHKFWQNTDPITDENDRNGGKWFVVYPNSILHAFRLCTEITIIMRFLGLAPAPRPIPHELQITPWVCTRYGSYSFHGVQDGQGGWRADNRMESHPPHINNPWGQYAQYAQGSENMTLDPSMVGSFPSYTMREIPQAFH